MPRSPFPNLHCRPAPRPKMPFDRPPPAPPRIASPIRPAPSTKMSWTNSKARSASKRLSRVHNLVSFEHPLENRTPKCSKLTVNRTRSCFHLNRQGNEMSAPSTPVRSVHTLAEILSQSEIWIACQRQLASDAAFKSASARLASAREILFVGCGSSLYLAESAAAAWTVINGRRTRALPASEILLFPNLCQLDVADLHVVVISRSRKTSAAVRAGDFLT